MKHNNLALTDDLSVAILTDDIQKEAKVHILKAEKHLHLTS